MDETVPLPATPQDSRRLQEPIEVETAFVEMLPQSK
jgi:hypothetical protein